MKLTGSNTYAPSRLTASAAAVGRATGGRCALAKRFASNTFHAVAETIVTRAPTRIDFGGGWTDVPPYSDQMGGFVCNLAIARYATVTVVPGTGDGRGSSERTIASAAAQRFRMADARIEVTSDFPIGAGLGGSSAAGVATVAALAAARNQPMQPSTIAELSREIEIGDLGI